ncbi:MAG: right-handed parallel beta-helix repeat-containing protein [Sedimentisphaerales bacterium]|nr:right-handed parallel beta-helix repeat-containing protein [Sedimentisphaerales bacterium]
MKALIVILAVLAGIAASQARIITVDDDGPADFSTIQSAIDDANDGDTVEIQPGTYTGAGNRDIDFKGKAITVRSTDPDDSEVVGATVVNCQSQGRGFYFHSDEDPNSVLAGLTITNGRAWGGGIRIKASSPLIANCAITNNYAPTSGNLYGDGGGILCELGSPIIKNCIITDNSATGIGGGLFLYEDNPVIQNCTIVGNSSVGIWCMDCQLSVRDSILWANIAGSTRRQISLDALLGCATLTTSYCDVEGGQGNIYRHGCTNVNWGAGNITTDPCFADSENGYYHLKSQAGRWVSNEGVWMMDDVTSPCIDGGDPITSIGLERFPNGGIINIGAYGGTGEASKSYFGKSPCETIVAGDINGDCIVDFKDFWLMALHWMEDHN